MDHSEYREEIPHGDHPHSYDHAEPGYRSITVFMAVTVVLLLFIGIGIQVYYEQVFARDTFDMVLSQPNWQLRDLRNLEEWELSRYTYIDKTKGAVRIPISEAMRLVAQDAAANQPKYPTASYRVKTPEELAAAVAPAVSQPGAAAANADQNKGATSSPNAQPPAAQHK